MVNDKGCNKKLRNLIVNSEFAKCNYPQLYEHLLSVSSVSSKDVETIENRELKQLFNGKIITLVHEECKKEWALVSDGRENKVEIRPKKDRRCQICNAQLKNLCFIKNNSNKTELHVGSDCLEHFGVTREEVKLLEQQIQAKKAITRKLEFNNKTNNDMDFVYNVSNTLLRTKIIIPASLGDEFTALLLSIKKLEDDYVNNDTEIDFEILNSHIANFKILHNKILIYDREHMNDQWVLTRKIAASIRDGFKEKTARLKNLGYIEADTLSLITEHSYCLNFLRPLNEMIKDCGLSIEVIQPLGNSAKIVLFDDINYSIGVSYVDLINAYGILLFDPAAQAPLATEFIKSKKNITLDPKQYSHALSKINRMLPSGVSFDPEEIEGLTFLISGEKFYTINIGLVINNLFSNTFNNGEVAIANWYNQLSAKSRGKPIDELKEYKNSLARSYASSRAFR